MYITTEIIIFSRFTMCMQFLLQHLKQVVNSNTCNSAHRLSMTQKIHIRCFMLIFTFCNFYIAHISEVILIHFNLEIVSDAQI